MTGDILELQKESFWKEHKNTLVRLRHDLLSGKGGNRTGTGARNVKPGVASNGRRSQHPPLGKYRRSPSPHLAKISTLTNQGLVRLSPNKFEVVPPLRPKLAFKPTDDFDSWGEESDGESDDYVDDTSDEAVDVPQASKGHSRTGHPQHRRSKYRPYPHTPTHTNLATTYKDPVPVFYPPPPQRQRKGQKLKAKKKPVRPADRNHSHRSLLEATSQPGSQVARRAKRASPLRHITQAAPTQTKSSAMPVGLSSSPETEEEDEQEEDKSAKLTLQYWQQHPMFAGDFIDWFIQDCLHTELCPDFLVDTFREMQHMPYDHPLYVPSLNCCEDIVTDHVSEMVMEVAREAVTEVANHYLDKRMLQRNPVEDFQADLLEDVVMMDAREIVRLVVQELAEDYLQTQCSSSVLHLLVDEYVQEIGPEMLEDVVFELTVEEFITSEVVAPEVLEEAESVARETVLFYNSKVKGREFKEVKLLADKKLAEMLMMELVMSVMSQQGNLWTEEEHLSGYLDGLIFNESVSQIVSVKQERDRTLYCKPLHKLHEKAVSDVALDVFLQQLAWSLDEDLADVDEYERALTGAALGPLFVR